MTDLWLIPAAGALAVLVGWEIAEILGLWD